MTDPVPDTKAPATRWMWLGVIVLLAVAFVIFLLNPDGDEELETIPDAAITTTEERLNTDLDLNRDLPPVNGAEGDTTITAEGGSVEVVNDPEGQAMLDDQ